MSNQILIKRSSVASKVPATTDLALGELAINTYDGKLYLKKTVSGTDTIVQIGSTNAPSTITYNPIQVATAGQTIFTVPSGYTSGSMMVYVNGYKLPPVDYSAVNGTSITLNVGSNVSDEIETVVFSTISIANALPSSGGTITGALVVGADATISSLNGGQLAGLRNKIINGNFDIWQRGTSFNNPTALYIADRWSIDVDNTSASWTIAKATALQDVADQGTTGILRFAVSTVGSMTFADIGQKIENVGTLQNQIATISCYHRFGTTAKSVYMYIEQVFGTGGSASVQTQVIPLQTGSTLTGFTKLSGTITVPSIAGKTIGGNSYLRVVIRIFTPSANDYCDITKVQVESGGASTPFETRPIGLELALCQRYYEITGGGTTAESASFVPTRQDFAAVNTRYQVTKRAVPTVTIYASSSGVAGTVRQIDGTGSPANITSTITSTVSEIVNIVGTYQVGSHYGFNFIAVAEL
jgi:hypothetical protein